jgi:hypothetical protein
MKRRRLCALAVVVLGASPVLAQQSYQTLRYDEDWSFLRDATQKSDIFDPVKYVPLDASGDWVLSLAGDARTKYEYFSAPVFNQSPADSNGFLLQRYLLSADLHATPMFRAFVQLQSSLENFRAGGPRPSDLDQLDLHQAFVDFAAHPDASSSFTLRVGRQELAYGSQRLVSVRDSPNNRLAFDAARLLTHFADWQVDAWVSRPVDIRHDMFDDRSDDGPTFWGVYATRALGWVSGLRMDLYYLGIDRQDAEYARGTADESRHSLGIRLFGRQGGLDWNFELVGQVGSFGHDAIAAWTLASDTGWTFADAPAKPRAFLHADVASGDHGSGSLGTFNPLFPRGAYFNEASLIGPQNLMDLQPGVELALAAPVSLSISCDFVWRESRNDGVYGTALNLQVPPGASDALYVGAFPTVSLRWQFGRHVTATLNYVAYDFGAFVHESRPDQQNGSYVSGVGSFRF